jgi:predicted dehydrogenase
VGAIHAEALHKLPESCFVAVADVVPPHAFAERYGVAPYTDIQRWSSVTTIPYGIL